MDDTVLTLSFELFPGRTLTLMPYESVTNAKAVFQALRVGKLPNTGFFNPKYIVSSHQIMIAANKALYYQAAGTSVAKEITVETLHMLTAQRNLTLTLSEFGIKEDLPQFIAFIFDATEAHIQRIRDLVQGNAVPITSPLMTAHSDSNAIMKHYKIDQNELQAGPLETAVINRIAVRDI